MAKKDKDNIWSVIVRYLSNTMTGNDSEVLEKWLEESNENRRILHSVDRIWKASADSSEDKLMKQLNLEKDWDKVVAQLQKADSEEKRKRIHHFRKLRKRQQFFSNMLKVAALILVAVTSGFLTLQYVPTMQPDHYEPVLKEITTLPGERANIDLGDGTRVMLNADSKLIMPDRFSHNKREVELKGQAFFDVKADRNRPFFIKVNDAWVEVIGTSFDVRSYEDESEIQVVVRDGTVEFRRDGDKDNRLILNPGYKGSMDRNSERLVLEQVDDLDTYLGWLDGRLIFKDTPFPVVLSHIERWYDVNIEVDLSDESLFTKKFTADLKTRSVRDVLDVIGMSMQFTYEVEGDDILIMN